MPRAKPQEFTASLICPRCGAVGAVVWENENGARALISLSSGFYERILHKNHYPFDLVCRECGAAQFEQ
jgi:ribosomal protein L40E